MKDFLKELGAFETLLIIFLLFVGLTWYGVNFELEGIVYLLYKIFWAVLPTIAVIYIGMWAWKMWVHYIQQDFLSGIEFIMLEVIPPREVLRSPKAMELFLTNGLWHYTTKGGREEFWQGAIRFPFSLEIASIEGQVRFYIRTPSRLKSLIETQMYAQYPQAMVRQVEDYTLAVDEISAHSAWNGWGCEFDLEQPEANPIKTYVDFGLDKDPKEEFKVDPISPIVEFFGSMQKGEQAWLQIVITPSQKKYHTAGTWFETHDWVQESRNQILKVLAPYRATRSRAEGDPEGGISTEIRVPAFLDNKIEGMTNKITKLGFDTGIRLMYVAKKEAFNMNNRRNIRLILRQFASPDRNAFKRVNSTQGDAFGSEFYGLSDEKVYTLKQRMLHEYQERGFFYLPMRHHLINNHNMKGLVLLVVKQFFLPYFHPPVNVLNTEEIATLWHFPGQILKMPTLERIESKEASPPTNLPI